MENSSKGLVFLRLYRPLYSIMSVEGVF
jgi:hypothetical protein